MNVRVTSEPFEYVHAADRTKDGHQIVTCAELNCSYWNVFHIQRYCEPYTCDTPGLPAMQLHKGVSSHAPVQTVLQSE